MKMATAIGDYMEIAKRETILNTFILSLDET